MIQSNLLAPVSCSQGWFHPSIIAFALTISIGSIFEFRSSEKFLLLKESKGPARSKSVQHESFLGSTGRRFVGDRKREYHGNTVHRKKKVPNLNLLLGESELECNQYGVVTTIHNPTESILRVANLRRWCLIIVGDKRTPEEGYLKIAQNKRNVFYLSVSDQEKMFLGIEFLSKMPFNSFARKNVGYLFAIALGARVIFDFDDDNIIMYSEDGITVRDPFWYDGEKSLERSVLLKFLDRDTKNKKSTNNTQSSSFPFNPYPHMGASHPHSWPRGFPIDQLQNHFDAVTTEVMKAGSVQYRSIGVIQSLCNGDPDVDAIFRLTRYQSTQFTFDRSVYALPLLIPPERYTPYNAQATIHLYSVFWGLFLPITVPGRVTDIWRSYITQRIMKDIGLYVMYTPPLVFHNRSDHDYLSDFSAENHLYFRTTELLNLLAEWSSKRELLQDRIVELWVELYERDYVQLEDVEAVKIWLSTLVDVGYIFPRPGETQFMDPVAQPLVEGQPCRARPYFNVNDKGEFVENQQDRPDSAIVKLIMMTMDEYPLVESWVLYHGELLGFENLHIVDSSTNANSISFLRNARDLYGVNVYFADVDLTRMEQVLSDLGRHLAGSSDFILKVDTDEFLVVSDGAISIEYYLQGFKSNPDHPLRREKGYVSFQQASIPDRERCRTDGINIRPSSFLMGPVTPETWFKAVYYSRDILQGEKINLGGHADRHTKQATEFGILHFHFRCIDIELTNCKRVLDRHHYLDAKDDTQEQISKLSHMFRCGPSEDLCSTCNMNRCPFASCHKAKFYLRWLTCPGRTEEEYYDLEALKSGKQNVQFQVMLDAALDKYL